MSVRWPKVPLGDVLQQTKDPVRLGLVPVSPNSSSATCVRTKLGVPVSGFWVMRTRWASLRSRSSPGVIPGPHEATRHATVPAARVFGKSECRIWSLPCVAEDSVENRDDGVERLRQRGVLGAYGVAFVRDGVFIHVRSATRRIVFGSKAVESTLVQCAFQTSHDIACDRDIRSTAVLVERGGAVVPDHETIIGASNPA